MRDAKGGGEGDGGEGGGGEGGGGEAVGGGGASKGGGGRKAAVERVPDEVMASLISSADLMARAVENLAAAAEKDAAAREGTGGLEWRIGVELLRRNMT
ncbi:MAG: hypothetical protein VXW27_09765, partial [Pseudomonadota bacterium]|nr:hypothetical protein [Pseudomonadota bacterium]